MSTELETLRMLYAFIDSAFADSETEAWQTLSGKRKVLRVYARSFLAKRVVQPPDDHAGVLEAITGCWCFRCGRFTTPCEGDSPDCSPHRHCGACGRTYTEREL